MSQPVIGSTEERIRREVAGEIGTLPLVTGRRHLRTMRYLLAALDIERAVVESLEKERVQVENVQQQCARGDCAGYVRGCEEEGSKRRQELADQAWLHHSTVTKLQTHICYIEQSLTEARDSESKAVTTLQAAYNALSDAQAEIERLRQPPPTPRTIGELVDIVRANCISVEQDAVDALDEIERRAGECR